MHIVKGDANATMSTYLKRLVHGAPLHCLEGSVHVAAEAERQRLEPHAASRDMLESWRVHDEWPKAQRVQCATPSHSRSGR